MRSNEVLLDDAARGDDAAGEVAFRRSLRASRARRAAAATRRRWSLRRRATIVVAAVATAGLAGGAVAAQSPSAASGGATQTLSVGAHGSAVAALQRRLGVPADGAFGPRTRRAVMRFQRRHGLTPDGVAGPATLRALGLGRVRATTSGAREAATTTSTPRVLRRIARCESGGNPTAVSASGRYRGKYQFDRATWRAMGGAGSDPAKASEAEQDRVAAKLLAARGTAPWPNCA